MLILLTNLLPETAVSDGELDTLILAISNGDPEALSALYGATKNSIYGFALSILKNTQDAEDVLHDLYVTVYSAAGSYRSQKKPLAWLLTITRNLCLSRLRERKRRGELPEPDRQTDLHWREAVTPEDRMVLESCLRALSDTERQIVILHAVSGFKHREIAELLDLSLPAVLSKYARALKELKKRMEREDETHA